MQKRYALIAVLGVAALAAAERPAMAQEQQQVITCSSDDGERHHCDADTRNGVSMGRQRSGSACVQGSSWGYDRRGVWVDKGCRADFVLNSYANGNGPGWDNNGRRRDGDDDDRRRNDNYNQGNNGNYNNGPSQTITCSSDDGHRHHCDADTRGGVQMVNQRSGSACTQGSTWGYDRRGIWVDRGCRADFAIGGNYSER